MKLKTWIAILVMVLIMAVGLFAVTRLNGMQNDTETELVRDAVKNAALSCYAVEGAYPEKLDYLKEHYGLVYDESRYIVAYDAFAMNVIPDIRVMERGSAGR